MTPWKPIESAPKDGTIILVGMTAKTGWAVFDAMFDGEWFMFDPVRDEYSVGFDGPEYWMPVPPKPLEVAA